VTLYRTITGPYPCGQCQQAFSADVQFRTGLDDLQTYVADEILPETDDLPAGVTFIGIGPYYCDGCLKQRQQQEFSYFYTALHTLLTSQQLQIQSGWIIKTTWTHNHLAHYQARQQQAFERGHLKPNALFSGLQQLTLTWHGELAPQGSMAYTNLLETINQDIRRQFDVAGWVHHGVLRHDLQICRDGNRLTLSLCQKAKTDTTEAMSV